MQEKLYWTIGIFAPVTFLIMFGVIFYIIIQGRKLYEEMQNRGLLIYSFPIIMPTTFIGIPNQSSATVLPPPPSYTSEQSQRASPSTGLPPPPAYTAEQPYGASPSTGLPPPPSYTSIFKSPPNVQSVPSVST